MSVACIICEYNPFHNGHEYLIKKAKDIHDDLEAIYINAMDFSRTEAILDNIANRFYV